MKQSRRLFKESDDVINLRMQEEMHLIANNIEKVASEYAEIYTKIKNMNIKSDKLDILYASLLKLIEDISLLEYVVNLRAEQITKVFIPYWTIIKQTFVTIKAVHNQIYELNKGKICSIEKCKEEINEFLEDEYIKDIISIRNLLEHDIDITYSGGYFELIDKFNVGKILALIGNIFHILNELGEIKVKESNYIVKKKVKGEQALKNIIIEDRQSINLIVNDKNIEAFIYYNMFAHVTEYLEFYGKHISKDQFILLADVNSKLININRIIGILLRPKQQYVQVKGSLWNKINKISQSSNSIETILMYYAINYIYSVYEKVPMLFGKSEKETFKIYMKEQPGILQKMSWDRHERYYKVLNDIRQLYIHDFITYDFSIYREHLLDMIYMNYFFLLNVICDENKNFWDNLNARGIYIQEKVHKEIELNLKRKIIY